MQLKLKTVLNAVHPLKSFVYRDLRIITDESRPPVIHALIKARKESRPQCSRCLRRCSAYDHLDTRFFQFVPLWGLAVFLLVPHENLWVI